MPFRKSPVLKILIVEDSPTDLALLTLGLQHLNRPVQINIVNNLKDAEELFNEFIFDIIFMDLHLPDSDTYRSTLDLVTKYKAEQNFVVMSSISDASKVFESYKAGAHQFLPKESLVNRNIGDELGRMVETCRRRDITPETLKSSK